VLKAPEQDSGVRLAVELGHHRRPAPGWLQVTQHGPQVQPRASDQQGPVPPRLDGGHGAGRGGREAGHGEVLARIDQVEKVMRDLRSLQGRRLGRTDVHPR